MSVINSMLLKLEARGAPAPAPVASDSVSAALPPLPSSRAHAGLVPSRARIAAIAAGGLALIAAVGLADWPRLMQPLPVPAAPAALAPGQAAATATAVEPGTAAAAGGALDPVAAPPETAAAPSAETAAARSAEVAAAPSPEVAAAPSAAPRQAAPPLSPPPNPEPAAAMVAPAGAAEATAVAAPAAQAAPAANPATPAAAAAPAPVRLASLAPSSARAPEPLRSPALAVPIALPARIDKRVLEPTAEERAGALHRQAQTLAQAGQRRAALEPARRALALWPGHVQARLLNALLEHETGQSGHAVELLQQGLAAPAPAEARASMSLLLAQVLVSQGRHAEALAALDAPGLAGAEVDALRGGILSQLGDFAGAGAAYGRALRERPGQALWWFGLAVALDSQQQVDGARQAYRRAQALGLDRPELVTYAGQRLAVLD